jgi:glycosyltransferase involved in cell wall biosynthesis
MIRYSADLGENYFVESFRNSSKIQNRISLPNQNEPYKKISVVTTCMNRLDDLKKTLPKNILDNIDYPSEFVLLDYGSTDGLEDWIKNEMMSYVLDGSLVYYKALNQKNFNPNHSRNMSFRLANGEIITNVDADNYTNVGFLSRINQCSCGKKRLIVAESFLKPNSNRLILRGRFAIRKDEIINLGGFDEDLDEGYSHDDVSFALRAILSGFSICRFEDKYIENRIETEISNRVKFVKTPMVDEIKHRNARLTKEKLSRCVLQVNRGKNWGAGTVIKNFNETISL